MQPRLHASCPCRTRPCMHPARPSRPCMHPALLCMHLALPACIPREVALGGQSSALTLRGGSARHASTRGAGGECGGLRPSPLLPALAASPKSEAFHSTSAEFPCRGRPPCIATCHNQTHSDALGRNASPHAMPAGHAAAPDARAARPPPCHLPRPFIRRLPRDLSPSSILSISSDKPSALPYARYSATSKSTGSSTSICTSP